MIKLSTVKDIFNNILNNSERLCSIHIFEHRDEYLGQVEIININTVKKQHESLDDFIKNLHLDTYELDSLCDVLKRRYESFTVEKVNDVVIYTIVL